MPSAVATEHEYVLARREDDTLVVVEDDDSLYRRFDEEVRYAYVHRLLALYEHTTEALIATDSPTAFPQTVANLPVIVVDSAEARALHDIAMVAGGTKVPMELALGLGRVGEVDLAAARRNFARVVAPLLLELAGLPSESEGPSPRPRIHQVTTPSLAFWLGFEAALESAHAEARPELLAEAHSQDPDDPRVRERLHRYELVPRNGLRYRFKDEAPTLELRSYQEAACTPGVVATFLYRLLERTGSYYPQRHLLWFASYEEKEIAYGKLLLAVHRMPPRDISLEAFVNAFAETFPSERDAVLALAEEVLGAEE